MYSAVILAGERPGGSALSRQLGLAAGVLADVAGKPAVQRVVEALQASEEVDGGLVCGPVAEVFSHSAEFKQILAGTPFYWLAPSDGPSASAIKAVRALNRYPVLLTTGDHALLTPALVDGFCRQAQAAGGDVVVGLTPWPLVLAAFPQSRRTVQKFRDGAYCGTNLFAIMNARGLRALEFWQSVEQQRKRPLKMAQKLGVGFLLSFLLRRLSLSDALQRLSARCNCTAVHTLVNEARAAVDVDTLADRELAEQVLLAEEA